MRVQGIQHTVEEVAHMFHVFYEELAPAYGYQTRDDTKEFDPTTPNGKLMVAVCEKVMREIVPNCPHCGGNYKYVCLGCGFDEFATTNPLTPTLPIGGTR